MSLAEVLREQTVSDLFTLKCINSCWPTWQSAYQQSAGAQPTAHGLIGQLGPALASVFRTTGGGGRTQNSLSDSGAAWEALICWYLNLCLVGTRAVVVKKTSQLPEPIRDALTLSYGSTQTNTESDLVAVTFPALPFLDNYTGRYSGSKKLHVDSQLANIMGQIEACVVQCKTNWNENAQIPMLWDLIYSAKGFNASGVSIGRNSHSIRTLKRFAYAFVTLPSQNIAKFSKNSMPVLRVSKLSGGNYWGLPRAKGIAGSVDDIFSRNFDSATQGLGQPWRNHLDSELLQLFSKYSYFRY